MRLALPTAILAAALHASPAAATPLTPPSTNLVANGSFETGDFTDWSGNPPYTVVMNQPYDGFSAQSGADYALLGPRGGNGALAQSFSDTRGELLTISFWLASDGGVPNDFAVSFDGHTLLCLSNLAEQGWTHYSETVTATGNDTLQFTFRNDPGYLALDSIAVTPSPVPEPATASLLLAGLGLAAAARGAARKAR